MNFDLGYWQADCIYTVHVHAISTSMDKFLLDCLQWLQATKMKMYALHLTADNFILQAFSISKVYGAYCDYGQNYKNLIGYVQGLGESIP